MTISTLMLIKKSKDFLDILNMISLMIELSVLQEKKQKRKAC